MNRQHQRPPRRGSDSQDIRPRSPRPVINHTKTSMARTLSRSSSPAVMVSSPTPPASPITRSHSPVPFNNTMHVRPPSRTSSLRSGHSNHHHHQQQQQPRWQYWYHHPLCCICLPFLYPPSCIASIHIPALMMKSSFVQKKKDLPDIVLILNGSSRTCPPPTRSLPATSLIPKFWAYYNPSLTPYIKTNWWRCRVTRHEAVFYYQIAVRLPKFYIFLSLFAFYPATILYNFLSRLTVWWSVLYICTA